MTISSSHLEAFLAVSQTLNFTQAAERLHITQSALSQRILNLEAELETTLFLRDRAGIKLTEGALELVRYCQMKNSLENELLSKIKAKNPKELAGVIRIGGFSSVMPSVLIPSLAPLLKQHPKLKIYAISRELSELMSLLKTGEIDYMILDDRIDRDELERCELGIERNVLVERKGYQGQDIFLDHDADDMITINYFKKVKKSSKPLERMFLDDIHSIMEGVRQGLGKAVLPLHLVKQEKNLQILNEDEVLNVPVFLYYYKQAFYTQLHQAVVKSLELGFKKNL